MYNLELYENFIIDYLCFVYKRADLKEAISNGFSEYLKQHLKEFIQVYSLLEDEYSKNVFEKVLKFRIKYLDLDLVKESLLPIPNEIFYEREKLKSKKTKYYNEIFKYIPYKQFVDLLSESAYSYNQKISCRNKKIILDVGAANGDSAGMFSIQEPNSFIYSFEPIDVYYSQLEEISKIFQNVKPIKAGAGICTEEKKFYKSGLYQFSLVNGASTSDLTSEKAMVYSIDDFVKMNNLPNVDFIKMDIEGAELSALIGSKETIKQFRPDLAICIYHSAEDLWKIILWIKDNFPEYKIYVNHELKKNISGTVCYATVSKENRNDSIRNLFFDLQFKEIIEKEDYFLNQKSDEDTLFFFSVRL